MKERARETEEANDNEVTHSFLKSSTLSSSLNQVSVDTIGTSEDVFSILLDPALHDWVAAGGGREEHIFSRSWFTNITVLSIHAM